MKSDKEFAIDLLHHVEDLLIQVSALQNILRRSEIKGWEDRFRRMTADPNARAILQQQFSHWRQTILESPDITGIAREILESLERPDPEG